MKNTNHILIVDDDDKLRLLLRKFLTENGFLVNDCENAEKARNLMNKFVFDFIILDVMMPGENGIAFAKRLRDEDINTPILMLTAKGEIDDKITGLESGVDDYLTKPFEPKELLLRIKTILKRSFTSISKFTGKVIKLGDLNYNIERTELTDASGSVVHLTSAESELLRIFATSPWSVISREELGIRTKNNDNLRSIDVQVTRLRKKIEEDSKYPRYLKTVRNKGYIFIPDSEI